MLQYSSGVYKIASWADVTNCHIIPGEGIITGLATVGQPLDRGLLLLANMSSKGSLSNSEYTNKNVEYAKKYSDFVFGFIGDQRFCPDVDFITMTPGVSLTSTGDTMGQCYRTPELIIKERGCDVIIVGRGIYSAKNPVEEAIRYRDAGWNCYLSRLSAEK
ncbi:Orotidine 5'-phosphate decarboxylase [Zancudomyces culisetae]|uniref:Orotidine 5'-phosphate decarboxylase n=1 Tax=Zancudomyces culisetae TaxID=1213189 RepID=A0A1R1PX48_ZANCU|nr:Orotidine 5'-phosphate decarboxylase [Zancudomyces culisetae]|eukprot:OMH85493.1 Orotidine 5'-phosphate decarboxylase [Zancudomyces culisetae]